MTTKNNKETLEAVKQKLLDLAEATFIRDEKSSNKNIPKEILIEFFIGLQQMNNLTIRNLIIQTDNLLSKKTPEKELKVSDLIDDSYISMYTCLKVEGDYSILADSFTNDMFKVYGKVMGEGSAGLLRLIKIGELHFPFYEPLIIDDKRFHYSILARYSGYDCKEELREKSKDLITSYLSYHLSKEVDSSALDLYEEIEKFEAEKALLEEEAATVRFALVEFFDAVLAPKKLKLSEIYKADIREFFKEALDSKMIITKNELNTFIDALKLYLSYISKTDQNALSAYKEILKISEERFIMMRENELIDSLFPSDTKLNAKLSPYFDSDKCSLIFDFDDFLIFLSGEDFHLTGKDKPKKGELQRINEIFNFSQAARSGNVVQSDYPSIDFFITFGFRYSILKNENGKLKPTPLLVNWLRLCTMDKFYVMALFLLSGEFLERVSGRVRQELLRDTTEFIVDFILSNEAGEYSVLKFFDSSSYRFIFSRYVSVFEGIGLIEPFLRNEVDNMLRISDFSKAFFDYYSQSSSSENNVIKLPRRKRGI